MLELASKVSAFILVLVVFLAILALLPGCQGKIGTAADGPDLLSQRGMLYACSKACGKELMQRYDPTTGECVCRELGGDK